MTTLHTGLHKLTKELKKACAGFSRGISADATVTTVEAVWTNAL